MSPRTLEDARRWVTDGTALFLGAVVGLSDVEVREPSALPDWTVGQVIGHVAANADALGNLADWARTGIETPMYTSMEARNAVISDAKDLPAEALVSWLTASAEELNAKLDELSNEQWLRPVVTRRGEVPASEIPWMRAREVYIHATDLGLDGGFEDLPAGFLDALVTDICAARGMGPQGLPDGPAPQVAAWLAGRPHTLPGAPELGPWL